MDDPASNDKVPALRIMQAIADLREYEAREAARGGTTPVAVLMMRLQRKAGVRPTKPRLIEPADG
jgi:hypothetical protein